MARDNFFRRGTPRPYICRRILWVSTGYNILHQKREYVNLGILSFSMFVFFYVYSLICSYSFPMLVAVGMLIATAS
ncbi:MAG: hypothetical protein HDS84_07715 [Bacteroidales bacterium]|nr:hypothetical protein [Bacteroidales bacterium]